MLKAFITPEGVSTHCMICGMDNDTAALAGVDLYTVPLDIQPGMCGMRACTERVAHASHQHEGRLDDMHYTTETNAQNEEVDTY